MSDQNIKHEDLQSIFMSVLDKAGTGEKLTTDEAVVMLSIDTLGDAYAFIADNRDEFNEFVNS